MRTSTLVKRPKTRGGEGYLDCGRGLVPRISVCLAIVSVVAGVCVGAGFGAASPPPTKSPIPRPPAGVPPLPPPLGPSGSSLAEPRFTVASAADAGFGVAFDFGSTYKALINPDGAPAGFEQPAFDDSSWGAPQTAPFAENEDSVCPGVFPPPNTDFPVSGTIYLRKTFALPENAFGLHIVGSVDNIADVYVNGHLEAHVEDGGCRYFGDGHGDGIDIHVPNSDLVPGGTDLVAVKASDLRRSELLRHQGHLRHVRIRAAADGDPGSLADHRGSDRDGDRCRWKSSSPGFR